MTFEEFFAERELDYTNSVRIPAAIRRELAARALEEAPGDRPPARRYRRLAAAVGGWAGAVLTKIGQFATDEPWSTM